MNANYNLHKKLSNEEHNDQLSTQQQPQPQPQQQKGNENNLKNHIHRPIPQRRYAFILANDEHHLNNTRSPPNVMEGLIRPVSAPAGFMQQQQQQHPEFANEDILHLERPSSPLSRVTNPMVRDNHFQRGIAISHHRRRHQRHQSSNFHHPTPTSNNSTNRVNSNLKSSHNHHHHQISYHYHHPQQVQVTPSD